MELTEQAYFEKLAGKQVLVLGLGVSNRPLVRMLLQYGIAVTGCDKTPREKLDPEVLQLEQDGCRLKLGEDYLQDLQADVVFRTPGIHPQRPELAKLRAQGAWITSEMDAFFAICPCPIFAVTGSDGKTTTTTLISEMLKKAGRTVWLGGNIGTPLLPLARQMKPQDFAVVELSSFQLLDMTHSPHVAVITNVAPNHLDVHRDMEEYVEAKQRIFQYQKPGDLGVFNGDNEITKSMADGARGTVRTFSRQGQPAHGVFFQNGVIYRSAEPAQPIVGQKQILLPGIHNIENYMAAICAVEDYVTDEEIRSVASSFGGVEHRIERVRVKDGVTFYNDSIASSPSRTMAALHSFSQKVILIAGGYDKHIPYDTLGPEIVEHVKVLVVNGTTGPKIKEAVCKAPAYAKGKPEILEAGDFYEAISMAARQAQPGDVVLFSPASASFDQFPNFMVRGQEFKKCVQEL